MTRWAYAYVPQTEQEYLEAINEAYSQAEGLYTQSEQLREEAGHWEDRAFTLEMELDDFLWQESLK